MQHEHGYFESISSGG